MKLIYPNNAYGFTADEEAGSYPATYANDEHPKKVWKGSSVDATLTITVDTDGGDAVAFFNTNASSVTVTVRLGTSSAWASGTAWATGNAWYVNSEEPTAKYELDPGGVGSGWADYTAIGGAHIIDLAFTAATGLTVQCGVVVAGNAVVFEDPMYGITEGLVDYSIVKELNNGATYTRKRDVVRTFGFTIWEERESDFYTLMQSVMTLLGPGPVAWRIVHSGSTAWDWVVYARAQTMPQGTHVDSISTPIDISLIEVV